MNILRSGYLGNMGFILDRDSRLLTEEPGAIANVLPAIRSQLDFRNQHFTDAVNGEDYETFTNYIPLSEWLIVQVLPEKSIYSQINQIRNDAFAILFISVTVYPRAR